jgi:thymidylate kinase
VTDLDLVLSGLLAVQRDKDRMPQEGKLIALEGEDDGLLAAQMERLHRWLQGQGMAVVQTAGPTNGPAGAQIQLHQQGRLCFDASCLALLWMTDRLDHLGRTGGMRAQLAQGHHVLWCRYGLYAYAHLLDRAPLGWQIEINARCPPPDLTLYVDTGGLRGRYRRAIERLAQEGDTIVHIDGGAAPEAVASACRRAVASLLPVEGG